MLPPLVQVSDAFAFGLDVTVNGIARASARVRGHLNQQISAGTSTINARGPVFRLPQRPVQSVTSVTCDGAPVDYELRGSLMSVATLETVQVSYSHGFPARGVGATPDSPQLPDELTEMICQLASRLSTPPDKALSAGISQQSKGPFGITYGMDAWKGQTSLTQAEKDLLARYWPRLPQPISLGAPASS